MIYEKIKKRLVDNKVRHFACDNISDYISEDEKSQLIIEVSDAFEDVLDRLLIDRENDPNSHGTAKRLAKMYINELFEGRYVPEPTVTAFPNEGSDSYDGMLVIRADIKSRCSHHWESVSGTAFIGIIPNGKVLGLSKYIRLAEWCARRGTLQEELCVHIRNVIQDKTGTENVAVYIEGRHNCCEARGVLTHNSLTQTASLGGAFKEADVKKEFYDNIHLQKAYRQ